MTGAPAIGIIRLSHSRGLPLPAYRTEQAAGMDLHAAISGNATLAPGQRLLVPTGLIIEFPEGYEGQVRPRSGLALNHGVTCLNSPGTIDADYRGEVAVLLINHGTEPYVIERGMRIAQLVVKPVVHASIETRREAGATGRGAGGFGSTGTK